MSLVIETPQDDECMLATIAVLADVPLSVIRQRACEFAKVPNWSAIPNTFMYWLTVNKLCIDFNLTGIPTIEEWRKKVSLRRQPRQIPSGKGSIGFCDARGAHICPFEDGLIYDPNDPSHPRTLKQYLKRNPFAEAIGIWVEKVI